MARADQISYYISVPNTALAPYTGPYATVTVNRTSTTGATITFNSLDNGTNTFLLAGNSAADVNVNGAFLLGAISGSNSLSGFTPGAFSDGGSQNVSSFGTFNQTIDDFDGFSHSATQISFGLTATGTNSWSDAMSVLAVNGDGYLAAIHGFVCADPCSSTSNNPATGYAANGGIVPEPSSLLLIGLGLAAMFGAVYYRRRDEFGDVA